MFREMQQLDQADLSGDPSGNLSGDDLRRWTWTRADRKKKDVSRSRQKMPTSRQSPSLPPSTSNPPSPSNGFMFLVESNDFRKSSTINKRITKLGDAGDVGGMLGLWEIEKDMMDHVNWATIMVRAGRMRGRRKFEMVGDGRFGEMVDRLTTIITNNPGYFGPRQLGNIVHSLGKIKEVGWGSNVKEKRKWWSQKGPSIQAAISVILSPPGSSFGPIWLNLGSSPDSDAQTLANVCWGVAHLSVPDSYLLFKHVDDNTAHLLFMQRDTQCIANVLWSAAKVREESGDDRVKTPEVWRQMEDNAEWFCGEATPQGVSNVALSCLKMGEEGKRLFEEIDKLAERLVKSGNRQSISNVLWAVVKGGWKADR